MAIHTMLNRALNHEYAPAGAPMLAPAAPSGPRSRPKPAPIVRSAAGDTVVPFNNMRRRTR